MLGSGRVIVGLFTFWSLQSYFIDLIYGILHMYKICLKSSLIVVTNVLFVLKYYNISNRVFTVAYHVGGGGVGSDPQVFVTIVPKRLIVKIKRRAVTEK
jgi:hypothetical protein